MMMRDWHRCRRWWAVRQECPFRVVEEHEDDEDVGAPELETPDEKPTVPVAPPVAPFLPVARRVDEVSVEVGGEAEEAEGSKGLPQLPSPLPTPPPLPPPGRPPVPRPVPVRVPVPARVPVTVRTLAPRRQPGREPEREARRLPRQTPRQFGVRGTVPVLHPEEAGSPFGARPREQGPVFARAERAVTRSIAKGRFSSRQRMGLAVAAGAVGGAAALFFGGGKGGGGGFHFPSVFNPRRPAHVR